MTNMAKIINSHAADIHPNLFWFDWRERLFFSSETIVYS